MLISRFTNVSEEDIKLFQDSINSTLPDQYYRFLLKYNGGETPDTKWTGKCRSDIKGLYGLKVEASWDINDQLKYEKPQELLKDNLLTIGSNSFGDWFGINLLDGSIWFVYHDKDKKIQIADTFLEFVEKSKSEPIGHIRTIEERKQSLWDNFGKEPSDFTLKAWQAEIDKYSNLSQEEIQI